MKCLVSNKPLRLFIVLLATLILISCDRMSSGSKPPLEKVTLAFTRQPQSVLLHIALLKGYFKEESLEITTRVYPYGKHALESVFDGLSDIATAAETPIMFNVLKGNKVLVLANTVASNNNTAVVARREAGISSAKDLRGKRIGYAPGTTGDFFLSALLSANDIARNEIKEVNLAPKEMLSAMQSHTVDAVVIWNYVSTQLMDALGDKAIYIQDKDIYTETYYLLAKPDYVQKHPETIRRFLRAMIKAEAFARDYPRQAQEIMAQSSKVDVSLVRRVWENFNLRVGLEQNLLITLEDETRWAIANKLTDAKEMPNYLSVVYFDGLRAVRPESIHIKE